LLRKAQSTRLDAIHGDEIADDNHGLRHNAYSSE
jgi:hypothetical protein